MGPNSWKGVQRGLQAYAYGGAIDGIPGPETYRAMQRVAAQYGYTGPIDGVLGPNSYRGFAAFLNRVV
jgi:peptidoglycan hydrolase-like protein with peptidoglycan-binding domain